jgi:hypothetical protein
MKEILIFYGCSVYKAAQKNGLMGTNGRMSRHIETTAKEFQGEGAASGRAGRRYPDERTGRFRLLAREGWAIERILNEA